jgi:hypothetical protein
LPAVPWYPAELCTGLRVDQIVFLGKTDGPFAESDLRKLVGLRVGMTQRTDQLFASPPFQLAPDGVLNEPAAVPLPAVDAAEEVGRKGNGDAFRWHGVLQFIL